jgi:hypothetical protein
MSDKTPEEIEKEFFEKKAAVTVAIMAAVLAIVTMCTGNASSDATSNKTDSVDKWAQYQSKSVKAHVVESEEDVLSVLAPGSVDEAKRTAQLAKCKKVLDGLLKDKKDISGEARAFEHAVDVANAQGTRYGYASLLLQIGIVIASVSILVRKNDVWLIGVILAVVAVYLTLTVLLPIPKQLGGLVIADVTSTS